MKKQEQKKKSGKAGSVVFYLICILIGVICGSMFPMGMEQFEAAFGGGNMLVPLLVFVAILAAACLIHIAVHEAGHLLLGLQSGYRFCSYRLGSLIVVREGEKLRLRRFSLKGTGGQCLMAPPQQYRREIPAILYNLGGCLLNLAVSLIFGLLLLAVRPAGVGKLICSEMAFVGILFALLNGIPLRLSSISNDGKNALEVFRSDAAHRAFWIQLQCVEQISRGVRLKDMPADWFEMPAQEDMKYSLCAYIAALSFSRSVDEMDFARAAETGAEIVETAEAMPEIQKQMINGDRLYCELVGECRQDKIEEIRTKAFLKTFKSMKSLPSVQRVNYACALLFDGDEQAAQKYRQAFEKAARSYPYPSEIKGEEELLAYAEKVYRERKS